MFSRLLVLLLLLLLLVGLRRSHSRYKEVFNYPKVGVPSHKGDTWFQFRNSGLENQYVLYKMKSLEEYDDAKVFINLNDEFPEGTTAFRATAASPDGKLYAYGLSESGSDWVTIKLRDVESGKALPDSIPWVKFSSISWVRGLAARRLRRIWCCSPMNPSADGLWVVLCVRTSVLVVSIVTADIRQRRVFLLSVPGPGHRSRVKAAR